MPGPGQLARDQDIPKHIVVCGVIGRDVHHNAKTFLRRHNPPWAFSLIPIQPRWRLSRNRLGEGPTPSILVETSVSPKGLLAGTTPLGAGRSKGPFAGGCSSSASIMGEDTSPKVSSSRYFRRCLMRATLICWGVNPLT